jgi:hypothetical protein
MATSLSIYGQAAVYIEGVLITEATEIESTLENSDQDVMTILKDFAGVTPSPQKRVTRVTGAIPVAGLEIDLEAMQRNRSIVECKVQMIGSGDSAASKGFVRNVSVKAGVGQTMTYSFEHHGQDSVFE